MSKPEAVSQKQHSAEVHAKQLADAYAKVFGSPEGHAVLRDIRDLFKTDYPAFKIMPTGGFDPLVAAHCDGSRAVYLRIERQIKRASEVSAGDEPKVTVNKP